LFGSICTKMLFVIYFFQYSYYLHRGISFPTGLHLNITEGKPIGKIIYNTLVDKDGVFLGKTGLRKELAAGRICLEEVIEILICYFNKLPVHEIVMSFENSTQINISSANNNLFNQIYYSMLPGLIVLRSILLKQYFCVEILC